MTGTGAPLEMLGDAEILRHVGRDEVPQDTQAMGVRPACPTGMSGSVLLERVQHLLGGDVVMHGSLRCKSGKPTPDERAR